MKLGIALSGGGIRGIAHAGVLKGLEENNIKIDIIGGTSSGSMVASLYAMGYTPEEIFNLFKKNAKQIAGVNTTPIISGIRNFILKKNRRFTGLKSGKEIENAFNYIASKKQIKKVTDIKMPIVVPTVDITESKEYVFTNYLPNVKDKDQYITDVEIGKMVRASSSFPAVFSPCKIKYHAFMDGGVINNIPVNEVKKQGADIVIAVKFDAEQIDRSSDIMDIVMKTIDIMGNKISEEGLEQSDYVLSVYTDKVRTFRHRKIR